MSNKGVTMIAVLPSALAEVLFRYCRGCDYGVKRHPHQCKAVKNFINQVKQKSNKKYIRQDEQKEDTQISVQGICRRQP